MHKKADSPSSIEYDVPFTKEILIPANVLSLTRELGHAVPLAQTSVVGIQTWLMVCKIEQMNSQNSVIN